jgi:hypothetical protein
MNRVAVRHHALLHERALLSIRVSCGYGPSDRQGGKNERQPDAARAAAASASNAFCYCERLRPYSTGWRRSLYLHQR